MTTPATSAASAWPPIDDLLPHRPPMRLIDAVLAFDAESVCVRALPAADAWYADADGNMPAWIAIELMAQAIATHEALWRRSQGQPPAPGVLLGTRRMTSHVASLPAGAPLDVHASVVLRDAAGNGAYDCHIALAGERLVEATLKVHQPSDFSAFLLEHSS